MKFEFLPNEVFTEIFEFLSIFDIFDVFNHLNDRFIALLHNIPLHLHFKDIPKSTFDRFCRMILSNPEVKKQIYSIELSNKETPGQIKSFLSLFSLDEFVHLHSLTLIQADEDTLRELRLTLPLIPQLTSFHLLDSNDDLHLANPLTSNLRILSIPTLQSIGSSNNYKSTHFWLFIE